MNTVLVTGASGGIGAAIARAFAAGDYGVALGYHRNKAAADALCDELSSAGATVLAVQGDVGNQEQVEELFLTVEDRLGPVNTLVNCAGLSHFGLLTELSLLQWEKLIRVNLTSVFLCCRRALPGMIARKAGCVINISSIWGEAGASCETAYSAAKAGVIGLTRALAREEGPSGIRVNCITPGLIETGMNDRLSAREHAAFAGDTALGRAGLPEEVAQAAVFLAENQYVTGEILRVDGGYL